MFETFVIKLKENVVECPPFPQPLNRQIVDNFKSLKRMIKNSYWRLDEDEFFNASSTSVLVKVVDRIINTVC